MSNDCLAIALPDWATAFETAATTIAGDEARMRFVIDLARCNVEYGTGGPFGAAIFSLEGRLIAIGVNSVLRLGNSAMHAEMMAIMRAQRAIGSHSLKHGPGHALYTSCEPCAMCLGGILWSGARRLVCGASAAAARAAGFDEGPVYPESYRHLEQAGIEITRGLLSNQASAVIQQYRDRGGVIYNG